MRILLDTNIFIPLEDSSLEIDEKLAELNRLVSSKHQLLIHPATLLDINRDKNPERKRIIQSRLAKYQKLELPPELDDKLEKSLFGISKKENDSVDNLILYAVHSNCVHWLITEDRGIHKKAKNIGEDERVLTVDQAIISLDEDDHEELNLYPNIQDVPCHTLNLEDSFFDSLRTGYDKFDKWFNNQCAKTGRHAWVWLEPRDIQAICIYKSEEDPIVTSDNQGLPGKTLKLCTFKVSKLGYKIGELLLKQAFNHAIDNKYEYVYATVEPDKHKILEDLLQDYGFYLLGIDTKGRDYVYVKVFPKNTPRTDDDPLEYAIKYYPYIKIDHNAIYLVPIQPRYHKVLFPELEPQPDLFGAEPTSAGNAIKQAYLCKSPVKSINPGDILFFYRTNDAMAVTTYGVVDQFHIEQDPEKIFQWVSKRTVYTMEEIRRMSGSDIKVILFRFIRHLKSPVNYNRLKELGIVKGPIQSIIKLDNETAGLLLNEARINDCTLLN